MAMLDTPAPASSFAAGKVAAGPADAATGYKRFDLGAFTFIRDEYFVKVHWPSNGQTRTHAIPADAFLRA